MKVLHIISKFSGGGLERRAIQTVKGVSDYQDIEQQIVVLSNEIEYKEVLTLPVKIYYLDNLSRSERLLALKSVLDAYRPDVVHSWLDHYPSDQIFLSILKYKNGYKYIHGAVCDCNHLSKMTSVWIGQKVSFICADAVVSNSEAGLVAKDAPQNKSVVIYNGFDFRRIPEKLNQNKKNELGITARHIVTMCGRIDGSKDWESFVEIAQLASNNHQDSAFIAIGNGRLIERYKRDVEDKGLKNILFIGRRTDVEELIGLSEVCVLLSNKDEHSEGVSNFIMESMASGKPVIATLDGGTPEIVKDGISGFLVNDNILDTYQHLKELLENDNIRRMMGEAAKKEILNRFTLSQMTEKYVELYNSLTAH